MLINCPYCRQVHVDSYKCNALLANKQSHVANTAPVMANVNMPPLLLRGLSGTYKYRDPEKRRAYMRAYMKRKREPIPPESGG